LRAAANLALRVARAAPAAGALALGPRLPPAGGLLERLPPRLLGRLPRAHLALPLGLAGAPLALLPRAPRLLLGAPSRLLGGALLLEAARALREPRVRLLQHRARLLGVRAAREEREVALERAAVLRHLGGR